jgi:hypothetical protein
MNHTGIYSGTFGLMAIIIAGLLLTTAYSTVKTNTNQNISDEMLKIKKAWQNIYITADSISSLEFGKLVTTTCPINSADPLKTDLVNLNSQLIAEINKTGLQCTNPTITNLAILLQGNDCKLSFNIRIDCKKEEIQNGKQVFMVEYDKTAIISSIKPLQTP